MSEKISAVTETLVLEDTDRFALAKDMGGGTFASRNVSVATLISELISNPEFIDLITTNQDFITELVYNSDFTSELAGNPNYINNQHTVLRTIVEPVAGTTYTLVLEDGNHKWKQFTNAAAVVVTVPAEATVDWPDNTYIELEQFGAGAVTIEGAVGVTINYNENLTPVLNGTKAVAGLKKTGTNVWNLFGNLVPA